jgi:chromosome segregation ATPase
MAKWGDLSDRDNVIVEMAEKIARLDAENRTIREVNAAQADNYANLARQLADREEQLRKAQERIRAAEAERDKTVLAYALQERRAIEAEAERDRAWNDAIEAACAELSEMHAGYMRAKGRDPAKYSSHLSIAATAIRSLIKGAGE